MNNINHPFIKIAGICSILAPIILFIGDLLMIAASMMFEWTIALWLSFVLFVPAILGLTFILFNSGSRLALFGGISAFFGAMAGASMQAMFRVYAVLAENGQGQTVELLRGTGKLVATTQMIGIFFPIGLILLAISLFQRRMTSSMIPLLLTFGAVLFPVGRIGGFSIAVISSDILLCAAFVLIGWLLFIQRRDFALDSKGNFAEAS
jgi:hypothetical protein